MRLNHPSGDGDLSEADREDRLPSRCRGQDTGFQGRRIVAVSGNVETASSSAERNRKQKEKDKLVKQLEELRKFDEELRHFADQRITLDLDDGVKVNYSKFGNLLAERKAITREKKT